MSQKKSQKENQSKNQSKEELIFLCKNCAEKENIRLSELPVWGSGNCNLCGKKDWVTKTLKKE